MDKDSHIDTEMLMLSRRMKQAAYKYASRNFIVKRGTEVLLGKPGFNWNSRDTLRPFTIRTDYVFEREEVIVDPVGRLTDTELISKNLVKAFRDEGVYAFLIPGVGDNQSDDRYAGWFLIVDSELVRTK